MTCATLRLFLVVCAALSLSCTGSGSSNGGTGSTAGDDAGTIDQPGSSDALEGTGGVAAISPAFLDFEQVAAGSTKTKTVRVTNTGPVNLELRKFKLSGHPDFRLLYTPEGVADAKRFEPMGEDTFFNPLIVVQPGTFIELAVSFTPETPDPATGSLVLFTNEPQPKHAIALQANTTSACIQVAPASVQFGAKLVGQKATRSITITSCSNTPLEVTGITITDNPTGNFSLSLASLGPGGAPSSTNPLVLPLQETATLSVDYVPNQVNPVIDGVPELDMGTVTITSNAFEAEITLELSAIGSKETCPTAVGKIQEGAQVIPQTMLHLFSEDSFAPAGGVATRSWIAEQPPGSQSVFSPSSVFPNPTFEANVVGTYTFTLDVWDEYDVKSCVPWVGTVLVVPDEAIHVELVWHTPNDPDETDEGATAGSNLDLHFVHDKFAVGSGFDGDGDGIDDPWFNLPYDCFWFNPKPNWGSFDPTDNDDPALDHDDQDGGGPENLNLAIPQNGVTYRFGVHYWNDHGFGGAYATVRVYIYQNLIAEFAEVLLWSLDMWCVATIEWPSGQVTSCLTPGGDYKITSNYKSPYFSQN
jgi:hypothetical protein